MTDLNCARCRKPAANHYRFYFGKETGEPMLGSDARGYQTVTHRFEVGGSEEVRLCDECAKGSWWDQLMMGGSSISDETKKGIASKRAISLRKGALRRQGWTHFWTESEYNSLSLSTALRR